jgi:hypothetical protein
MGEREGAQDMKWIKQSEKETIFPNIFHRYEKI